MDKKNKNRNTFAIIGLGRFGMAVAKSLLENGKDVICIDIDMAKLKSLQNTNARLCHIDEITLPSLKEAGIADCDVVVVGIGKDIESNILAAMDSLELGVKTVISKATNDESARILEKIGAKVVYPEVETARRLGVKLVNDFTEDVVPLSDDFFIMQFTIPESLTGKTVLEANLRQKYSVNIVAIIHDGKANATIRPDTILEGGDSMVVSGTSRNVEALQKGLNNN